MQFHSTSLFGVRAFCKKSYEIKVGNLFQCLFNRLHFRYLSLGLVRHREMGRKMHAMYQSVLKVEKVCYNVKVRGSEAAIWSSNDASEKERDDIDEGFVNY